MSENAIVVCIFAVAAAWLYQDWKFQRERADWAAERKALLDRIMAKSLPELNYEKRKEEVLRRPPALSPAPSDAELADWEAKHRSQVADANAEAEARIAALRRQAVASAGKGA